jgi:insulysin
LSHLIGHEGDGSVLSYLKKKGWALELSAGLSHGGNGFDFFKISVTLTEAGLTQYVPVIEAIFEYIQMLKNEGVKEWIFKEVSTLFHLVVSIASTI